MPKRSIFIDLDAPPGEQLAPEVVAEIQRVAPSTVTNGSITEAKLAEDAVTTIKIADDAVTQDKIAGGAVGSAQIQNESITSTDLADNAVTGAKAGLGVVTATDDTGTYIETVIWHGSAAQYALITAKDSNTDYYVTA